MDINLIPLSNLDPQQFAAYVGENFRRITDALKNASDERKGVSVVTGSATVTTGLTKVQFVAANFYDDPAGVDTLVLSARPSPTAGSVLLKVFGWGNTWNPTLIASTTPINVAWVAYGF